MRALLIYVVSICFACFFMPEISQATQTPFRALNSNFGTNGHTVSWDGRLYIGTIAPCQSFTDPISGEVAYGSHNQFIAKLFKPEAIDQNQQQPFKKAFSSQTFTFAKGIISRSTDLRATCVNGGTFDQAIGPGDDKYNALAIVPYGNSANDNPFKSDIDGKRNAKGSFLTYDFWVYTPQTMADFDPTQPGAVRPMLARNFLYRRRGYITIQDSRTAAAVIVAGGWFPGSQRQILHTLSGQQISGIEPTFTADGRLFILNTIDSSGSYLSFSFNQNPNALTGWSDLAPLSQMHSLAEHIVDGIRFADRFPIAKKPLRWMSGIALLPGEPFRGAYPWIDQDGSEIFYESSNGASGLSRTALSVIGRSTGYAPRHIDNWLNPDRGETQRLFISSPGLIPGMWNTVREMTNPPIPYFPANGAIVPLISSNTGKYGEVSYANHRDGNYAVYLEMNELIGFGSDGILAYIVNQTPDTSGNFNNATFSGDVRFPFEQFEGGNFYIKDSITGSYKNRADGSRIHLFEDQSISGQAVYLGANGAVIVRHNESSLKFASVLGFTSEFWVKSLTPPTAASFSLVRKGATFKTTMNANRKIRSTVRVSTNSNANGFIDLTSMPISLPQLDGQTWCHIAITYDPKLGVLVTHVNGEVVDIITAAKNLLLPLPLVDSAETLVIGPGAAPNTLSAAISANLPHQASQFGRIPAVLMIDEVKISTVVRSLDQIRASALLKSPQNSTALGISLPLGLASRDLRLPASEQSSPALIHLGEKFFFDKRLSSTGTVSCATCHQPSAFFRDVRGVSSGVTGLALPRVAPSVLNRAFSTVQTWGGDAASLEDQAHVPLFNPDEMGTNAKQLSQVVNDIPEYKQFIQTEFNQRPNTQNIISILGTALASFQRSLMSGNSLFDQYSSAQNMRALSANQILGMKIFFGKGRCVACHSNSNFTDESFHRSILFGQDLMGTDGGLANKSKNIKDIGKFKTPSLRNTARFDRYFHNGKVKSLEEVVALYNNGPVNSADEQDPELRPLGLTAQEQSNLVAFLETLTSLDPMPALQGPKLPALDSKIIGRSFTLPNGSIITRNCHLKALGNGAVTPANQIAYAYCLVLARTADPDGLNNASKHVQSGNFNVISFLLSATQSPEFKSKFSSALDNDIHYKKFIYMLLMQREPSYAELARVYLTKESLIEKILQSSEFANLHMILAQPSNAIAFTRLAGKMPGQQQIYTEKAEQVSSLVGEGWKIVQQVGKISPKQNDGIGLIPLYRLYLYGTKEEFYTTSASERNRILQAHYGDDRGVAGYVFPANSAFGTPLYRLLNLKTGYHFYTTILAEQITRTRSGWILEGVQARLIK